MLALSPGKHTRTTPSWLAAACFSSSPSFCSSAPRYGCMLLRSNVPCLFLLPLVHEQTAPWSLLRLTSFLPPPQCNVLAVDIFLARWTDLAPDSRTDERNVGIYGGLVLGLLIMATVRAIWFISGMMRASQRLHDSIFIHVMRAPILFFDNNPIGRILNRFSKDLGFIDQLLPYVYVDFIQLAVRELGGWGDIYSPNLSPVLPLRSLLTFMNYFSARNRGLDFAHLGGQPVGLSCHGPPGHHVPADPQLLLEDGPGGQGENCRMPFGAGQHSSSVCSPPPPPPLPPSASRPFCGRPCTRTSARRSRAPRPSAARLADHGPWASCTATRMTTARATTCS